jgi:predicted dehydrogenase|tara:strand:- start:86 stop:976 length:891 start_codon:yes stop_codon:yes gene_type:complete
MNIGIFGVGSFGEKHINVLLGIEEFNIVGFFDPNQKRCIEIAEKFNIKSYSSTDELIKECEAIDIVSSTDTHYKLIELGIEHEKHIFVEKPICLTNWEREKLLEKSSNYSGVIQVGHIERYNPILSNKTFQLDNIKSIESARTGTLNERNQNTPITLDLMIHDIDLILETMQSEIIKIAAEKEYKNNNQKVSCEIHFKNNKIANLIVERGKNTTNTRKMRITCINKIVEIDLLKRIGKDIQKGHVKIWESNKNINPLKEEFLDFKKSIENKKKPKISVEASCNAVEVALKIEELIN